MNVLTGDRVEFSATRLRSTKLKISHLPITRAQPATKTGRWADSGKVDRRSISLGSVGNIGLLFDSMDCLVRHPMAISMFSNQTSPIAIDFGSASIKMLQINPGDPPSIQSAAEIEVPDDAREDMNRRFDYLAEKLPKYVRKGKFKGKRVVCCLPSTGSIVQHMHVPQSGGIAGEEYINSQLQIQTGMLPGNMVVRTSSVKEVHRETGLTDETICFALPKEHVMRHVDLLKRCKLEVVGVHTEQHTIVWAFHHLHQRTGDENVTTLYVDLGWGNTKVAISHGDKLVFSKNIDIGGCHFDQQIAETLNCDIASARGHRLAAAAEGCSAMAGRGSSSTGSAILDRGLSMANEAAATATADPDDRRQGGEASSLQPTMGGDLDAVLSPGGVDCSELIDSLTDELAMCLRYHQALFEDRKIDRAIFVGGESRQPELCRTMARRLNVQAQLGDPLGRFNRKNAEAVKVKLGTIQPGWTVACGLVTGAN